MKRIKSFLLIIMFIMVITINVKADDFKYYLSVDKSNNEYVSKPDTVNIQRGEDIYVVAVVANSSSVNDYQLGKGKLTIRWDDKALELVKIGENYYDLSESTFANLTIGKVDKGTNKLTIHEFSSNQVVASGINKLVKFKFHVLDNAQAGTTKIYQMDGEDSITCYNATEERSIPCAESLLTELNYNVEKSKINSLASLKINDAPLEYFDENILEYNLEVDGDQETINIEVEKKDSLSGISEGYGKQKLSYGLNTFKIVVTSEAGIAKTYTINVTRTDDRSTDNTLKSLTLSSGEIKFKSEINDYTVNVSNDVNHIKVTSELNDSKAKYVTGFGDKEIDLIEGSNKILIKVVNEKNEENIYTITINRALSSNNSLKSLKVNDEKITLVENEFTYDVNVNTEVTEAVIVATPNDEKAKIELKDKYELIVGNNEIPVVVEAPSGDKATYIINITRDAELSSNSLLSKLEVKGYALEFKKNVYYYTLKIKDDESKLEINAEAEDTKAEVNIEGNNDLINGSIVKINVKAENGTYTRYFINIEKSTKNRLLPIIIIIIVLLILLAGCITYLVIRRKKQKEKEEFHELDKPREEIPQDDINLPQEIEEPKEEVKPLVPEEKTNIEPNIEEKKDIAE